MNPAHEANVREARKYFDKMTNEAHSVITVEGLYAKTIRGCVADGTTTWDELGFTEAEVASRVREAKVREGLAT